MDCPILVLGAGIIGLTTAAQLLECGQDVVIYARESSHLVSHIAAAVWFPYQAGPRDKVIDWGKYAYKKFQQQSTDIHCGVQMVDITLLYNDYQANPWWENAVPNYTVLQDEELRKITPLYKQYRQAYIVPVPLATMTTYMPYLKEHYQLNIIHCDISDLQSLFQDYPIIVNCTGMGARELINDQSLYPIRGQIVIAKNIFSLANIIDEDGPLSPAYILQRDRDVVLGGTAEFNCENTTASIDDKVAQEIIRKCQLLSPQLKEKEVVFTKSLAGLRPGRKEVRVELEFLGKNKDQVIIHNYGHGGSGMTLSWGCALEVAEIIAQL